MVARAVGTVAVNSSNSVVEGIAEESSATSDTAYTQLRRSDRVRIVFTNSGTSTNKLKITPLISGVFINLTQTISGSGSYDFTISSTATLGKQTGPVLKLEAQTSSGTALSGTYQTTYVYLDIHAASSGTVYPYSIGVVAGGKGLPANTNFTWTGSGSDPSSGTPPSLALTEGDVLELNTGSYDVSLSYESNAADYIGPYHTLAPYPLTNLVFKTFPNRLRLGGSNLTGTYPSGTVVAHETLKMTTDGTNARIKALPNNFNTNSGSKLFKITGDGTPNAFSDTETSVTAADTFYTQNFTVGGLGTGKEAVFFVKGGGVGGGTIKLSGDTDFVDRVTAGNGDTITVRGKSSASFDLARRFVIIGMNANGSHVESNWRIAAPTVGDATYGMEFFNSSGTKLLSINDRAARFVKQATVEFTSHASSTTKTVNVPLAAVEDSDEWKINAWVTADQTIGGVAVNSIVRKDGSFDISAYNYSGATVTYDVTYQVLYSG